MKTSFRRFPIPCAFALAAALLLSAPVEAAQLGTISSSSYITGYYSGGDLVWNIPHVENLCDGDVGTGISDNTAGSFFIMDFSQTNEWDATRKMYVGKVSIHHAGNGVYSIYQSSDGASWTPVFGASNVVAEAGWTTFYVGEAIQELKYVFEDRVPDLSLCEFKVEGYVPPAEEVEPTVISKTSLAKNYNPNGTLAGGDGTGGFGGGAGIRHWFDGNKKTNGGLWDGGGGTWLPNLSNGGWCLLDFSGEKPQGYYVTTIAIYQCNPFPYSLYWSNDGTTWTCVTNRASKVGEGIYDVNQVATQVKVVFDETGGWTVNISEIEVKGMDPSDVSCSHPGYTSWAYVEGSGTCLQPGTNVRFCTACGHRFETPEDLPLGHDYYSHLDRPGKFKQFGSGFIGCTRCDWRLDFPFDEDNPTNTAPLNLITTKVDGTQIGRVSIPGQVNFTEITVTTTGNGADEPDPSQNWGVNPVSLYDGNWTFSWQKYWYSQGRDTNPHVDYAFGTTVDLARVVISLPNVNHQAVLYSYDETADVETEIARIIVEQSEEITGDDGTIRTNVFYQTPVQHLRIRQKTSDGETLMRPMKISEVHVYGTVAGAGDWPYDKRSILIFR